MLLHQGEIAPTSILATQQVFLLERWLDPCVSAGQAGRQLLPSQQFVRDTLTCALQDAEAFQQSLLHPSAWYKLKDGPSDDGPQ